MSILYSYWYLLVPAAGVIFLIQQRHRNGLSRYPGPFVASFTDFWRLYDLWSTRRMHDTCVDLHRKHGDVVRLGPNLLSFADPRAIKDIYGLNKGFTKVCQPCFL